MSSERYYFWSSMKHTHPSDPMIKPEFHIPRGSDTKILMHYYKISGRGSIYAPAAPEFANHKLVARTLVLITLSDYKRSSQRQRGYNTEFMTEQLSKIGVPGQVQPDVLEKLFGVIKDTVPGMHIIVLLGEATLHLTDSEAILGEGDMMTTLPLWIDGSYNDDQQVMPQRLTMDGRYNDDQQFMFGRLTTEPRRNIPKVKVASPIHDLEKVRLDSLDAGVRQMPCAICMEGLDHFDAAKYENDHLPLIARLPCLHIYHENCILQWLETDNSSCPICRSPVLKSRKAPMRLHWPMLMMSAVGLLSMLVPRLLNRS